MCEHHLTLSVDLQNPSRALRNFFASQRSGNYTLAQEKFRNIPRVAFSATTKGDR